MTRIGVLGGTFDPIHLGHLVVGEEARDRLDLDRLVFMPAGSPRLKEHEPLASATQRLDMVRLAVDEGDDSEISTKEVVREGSTYTVDTIAELRQQYAESDQIYFMVGMDALEQFDRWKEPDRLLQMCNLVVVNRVGHQRVDVNDFVGRFPEAGPGLTLLTVPRLEISSTDIRNRVRDGRSIKYLTPEPVVGYIEREGLYR